MIALISSIVLVAGVVAQQASPPGVVPQLMPSSNELAGNFLWQQSGFKSPVACAISSTGIVAVADAAGELVGLRGIDGAISWRTRECDGGAIIAPAGVAARADGSFLMTDSRRRRMDAFSTSGEWKGRFAEATPISTPGAIAVGRGGQPEAERVAVIDEATREVILLDGKGNELLRLEGGDLKASDGAPIRPTGIAFAGPDLLALAVPDLYRVFLVDCSNERAGGVITGSFGGRGPFPGFFNSPVGIAASGNWIFVADEFNHRVARHDPAGKGQLAYGQHAVLPRAGEGAVHYPVAVAVTESLAVVCEPFERRVQAYAPSHAAEPADLRLVLPKLEGVQSHFAGASACSGQRLFLHDPESRSVIVFDLSKGQPIHVTTLGSAGPKPHEFGSVDAMVALDGGLRLLVADNANHRLALWELTPPPKEVAFEAFMGKLVKTRPYERLGLPGGAGIVGLARTPQGTILALSDSGPTLVEFDPALRTTTAKPLPMPDTVARATALAVDSEGTLAVLVDSPAAIATFRSTDDRWAPQSMLPLNEVRWARAIAAASPDTWIVIDEWGDAMVEVAQGVASKGLGRTGIGDSEFWLPSAVVVGPEGERYIVDSGNHRAQRFDKNGQWEMTFSLGRAYTKQRSSEEIMRVRRRPNVIPPAVPTAPATGGES